MPMHIHDFFFYVFRSLIHRGVRTWLTVIGVVIGITAIILLISIAEGLREDIQGRLNKFGPRNIVVIPGSGTKLSPGVTYSPRTGKLFLRDYETVRSIPGVKRAAYAVVGKFLSVSHKDESVSMNVVGVSDEAFRIGYSLMEIDKGRLLKEGDHGVALIGHNIAANTFSEKLDVGSKIRIGNETFRIVGILKPVGMQGMAGTFDNIIFIPVHDAETLTEEQRLHNEISLIFIEAESDRIVDKLVSRVEEKLRSLHHVSEDDQDFTVVSSKFFREQVGSILNYVELFLGGVAAVSLLVGGLGIMNAMFMFVTERIPEIGILKSLGATRKDILTLFLMEGGLIGLTGGIVGVLISLLFYVGASNIVKMVITPYAIVLSLVIAFVLGIVASYLPARQAADADILEALGRER